jgi:hypothetical protein
LFIGVSAAVPGKLHKYDMESVNTGGRVMARKIYTGLNSEHYDQHGKENERGKRTSALKQCDEDQLLSYLTDLQAINPESIVNMATLEPVNCVCR